MLEKFRLHFFHFLHFFQGANVEGPGHIRAHTDLTTWIGEMDGTESERVTQLCQLFTQHGLPSQASNEIRKQVTIVLVFYASGVELIRFWPVV